MTILNLNKRRTMAASICIAAVMLFGSAGAYGDTTLLALDWDAGDLWSIDTAMPVTGTSIGGPSSSFIAEIEFGNGVIYGPSTATNTELFLINPNTGLIVFTIDLVFPPQGDVLTALELVDGTLYAGLTTEGSQGGAQTYLSTVDLGSGLITVVGAAGISFPFGGLAYDETGTTMYAISSGGGGANLYTVDMGTGAATMVAPVLVDQQPIKATALEFGGDGVLYTAPAFSDALFGHLLTIDPADGTAVDLGSAGLTAGAVALTYQAPAAVSPDTTLAAWDTAAEDLWNIDTAPPPSSTFVGGGNAGIHAEIEYRNGVIYGADTDSKNLNLIDPLTGLITATITLTYPPEGDVLTSLEFVSATLYAGLTTEGSQGAAQTYLATVDLGTGLVTVVGGTGVNRPFGGLAYDGSNSMMFAISAGGSTPMLYTVDLSTGVATGVAPVSIGGQPFKATALEFGGDGMLYAAPNMMDPLFGDLLTIDPMSGLAINLGSTSLGAGAVALTYTGMIFDDGFESGDTSEWSETLP